MIEAALYARRSTDMQDGSLPAQWKQLREYAATNGYEIIERFEDDGISGTSLDRPGLNALIAAASNGAAWTHVLVWDRSRLGRPEDPREAIAMTYQIERHGKTIVPLHGQGKSGNPVMDTILEALEFGQAGEESIRKSRDVLRGKRQSAERKSIAGGKPPFGYDGLYLSASGNPIRRIRYIEDGSKQHLSVDGKTLLDVLEPGKRIAKSGDETLTLLPGVPHQVTAVQRIFREYLAGDGPITISRGLTADGILSPRGGRWGKSSVMRILENPAYKGTFVWNMRSWGKFHRAKGSGEIERVSNPSKKLSMQEESEWVQHANAWEPLVSPKDWDKTHERRKPKRRGGYLHGKGRRSNFLASGLITCTHCGKPYRGNSHRDSRNKHRIYEYYRCAGLEGGPSVCTAKNVRREVIDDYLERRIREIYHEPAGKALLWRELSGQVDAMLSAGEDRGAPDKDRERLTQVQAQIDRLVDAVASGALSHEEIAGRLTPLRKDKADLETRLAAAPTKRRPVNPQKLRKKILDACREKLQGEEDLWPTATPAQRKEIVRAHVAGITADQYKMLLRTEFYPILAGAEFGILGMTTTLSAGCGLHTKPIVEVYNWKRDVVRRVS